MSTEIPLRNREGEVVATAVVDDIDADLADHRWCRDAAGYAVRTPHKGEKQIRLHTVILERMGHPRDTYDVGDHINRVRLDNRRSNLRPATHSLNALNRPGALPEPEPRDCAECETTFTPRRKSANMAARFCSRLCQRRHQARVNAPVGGAARWSA